MSVASRAITLAEIVDRFGGELVGSRDVTINQVATLQSAGPGQVAFLAQGRYRTQLQSTRAAAVILPHSERDATSIPRILCEDPYLYFAKVSALFNPAQEVEPGIHPAAFIEPGARIAPTAYVGPGCHIGRGVEIGDYVRIGAGSAIGEDCRVGEGSLLHPSVVLYAGCRVGRRAVIHSGVVIGADGFGMAPEAGRWVKIPQIGSVIISDDVEIGANTTIDRGTLEDTVIEEGVKLDNQIQIGHNVRVGAHTAMAGCVGIAGSAHIGRHCTLGGGAIVLGHLQLADGVHVSAGSLVMKSITQSGTYSGVFPLQENRAWARTAVLLRNIDELAERIRVLERMVADLRAKG